MSRRRIKNILLKEWRVLLTSVNNILFVTLLPLLIVGQLTIYIKLISEFGSGPMLSSPLFQTALERLRQAVPGISGLSVIEQLQVLLLSQSGFFLLLIATMIAINFAAFSIVEEKLTRSLEALLATPVRTWELLLGKIVAGAVPAVTVAWLCAGVFLLIATALGWGNLVVFVLTPSWFLNLFLLTPTIALLSFTLGVIGSSRAQDVKSAQNIALAIVFPVFALIGVQVTGLVWFTPLLTLALTLGLVLVDILMLRVAVHLFQRESIVVQWR